MTTWACAHCGQVCGDYAGGSGSVTFDSGPLVRLCHPDDPARPDCYRRVTVYREPLGALIGADPKPPGVTCIGNPGGEAAFREMAALGDELQGEA